jgi:hypothetical protein
MHSRKIRAKKMKIQIDINILEGDKTSSEEQVISIILQNLLANRDLNSATLQQILDLLRGIHDELATYY